MSLPATETPLGAMRFNSDSQKLEYFNGEIWLQIHTFNSDLDGGARGIWAGGSNPACDVIEYVTIPTAGNGTDFGNLASSVKYVSGGSSNTRGVTVGGEEGSTTDRIQYVTISITGNATDFGDLTESLTYISACSNQTRLVTGGGKDTPGNNNVNTMDFVTIATIGNAQDFGDLTRCIGFNSAQCGSTTRGIVWGGYSPEGDNIEYFTFATKGNTVQFGDSTIDLNYRNCTSDCVRGLAGGGQDGPGNRNTIEYIQIATQGNAVDFGDLTTDGHHAAAAFSNAHGGLG